ncbi:MAG TPA: inositol monophosphatase family protein [Gemmatimonadales bacterium]|nr:inositol monophosphatase family protein [Gemmatimonadales bacterium]
MDLLESARRAATLAAAYLRTAVPPDPEAWTAKGQNDFVTEVDRHAEEIIRGSLLIDTPNARVIGEELGSEIVTEGLVWIVDPLDGTTNFLHRYPSCSVSIAAAIDGTLEAGVVLRLEPDWCYTAARGRGAWHGTSRLQVSRVSQPAHALIGTGFPFKHPDTLPQYQRQFARVMNATSGIRRAGSAALDLADVASGKFDGFWELQLAPWDVSAGILLVREAGGVVTDLEDNDRGIAHGPVVAGNPVIHEWLVRTMANP